MNGLGISTAIGIGVRSLLGSAFLGGVLRLLVSIDARLEARA
jgi:succinyl-CoA synthetase alpha subunit